MKTADISTATSIPVVEVFGPTIQGEGALAGLPTMFVRLGYCDYRCSWCDSMFAVEPELVKQHAERLTPEQVCERLDPLNGWSPGMWVTLSGGNPAIHDLELLVDLLHADQYHVAVETQGSVWRGWLRKVDHLVVSPKPPSSGMATSQHREQTSRFLDKAQAWCSPPLPRSMKIVVFDEADLAWARDLVLERPGWPTYLSVGTVQIGPDDERYSESIETSDARQQIGDSYRWLCEAVAGDPVFVGTRVLPQLHVIAWGHARAV